MNDKFRMGLGVAAAVLIPLVGELLLDPPAWGEILLAALGAAFLTGVSVKVAGALRQRERELQEANAALFATRQPMPEPQPVQQPEAPSARFTEVSLPSAEPDYAFIVSAGVRWAPTNNGRSLPGDAAALAKQSVLDRILAITRTRLPEFPELLRHKIAAELSVPAPDDSGSLFAWADELDLVLDQQDEERLTQLAVLRKKGRYWEHQRRYEISERDYLSNDVFKSTGSAVVWQLAQNRAKVVDTVDLIDTMTRLTAAANDNSVPAVRREFTPVESPPPPVRPGFALVDEMFPAGESGQRDLFQDQLADLTGTHGRPDIADELRVEPLSSANVEPEPDLPVDPDSVGPGPVADESAMP